MRRLFVQFYLLLMACFLVAVVMVGVVYKQAVDDVGERYLADLLRTTLSLIEADLRGVPEDRWSETLANADYGFTFRVKVEKMSNYILDEESREALDRGEIVMLEDKYLFLQKLQDSNYLLVAGPLRYLFFLHRLKWFDYALLGLLGLSLAIPVFLWMRPHWRDLVALERTAGLLANGDLSARVDLPPHSGVHHLGVAFNHMADNIGALINSKKTLTNAVAHELRTPLARLRYRLALLEGDEEAPERQAIERDLTAIDKLVEELLFHARLDRPEAPLTLSSFNALPWARDRIAGQAALAQEIHWIEPAGEELTITADEHLITRALDNLLSNARRHANAVVATHILVDKQQCCIIVDDDGPGIPEEDRERVFDPFIRLDESRGRKTGGHGLGLAIVAGIARAHRGSIKVESSPMGGARFLLRWPTA
ncbi:MULTISPECIES: two-component system sensor histidine kinase RstB [Chromobacteriaceae]|uniref:histidine kinase n=2 Tax=Chromobacterium TaxID=535 RepID=A0A1D9LGI8_9NEIS|nr:MULTISPECIES: two-component system sensor histidine kinase RstB [Chromobacteriaceae]AOZ50304.1 sensor histidine kinase [Chromobacterium vaccinii]MCD4503516.1 two-component system sensor histidine kinase RstB [Chromobacterium piscinae]MCD5330064.1 two-component system sensor histidine kinase RstB [Chromobacterium piscinae]QND83429.1 Sensory histidine kinase [Chromobacterium vaccinii]QND88660.1 Sensory histidine kinase [Chromobacterium vaccinii]